MLIVLVLKPHWAEPTLGGSLPPAEPAELTLGGLVPPAEPAEPTLGGSVPPAEPAEPTLGGPVPPAEPAEPTLGGSVAPAEPPEPTLGRSVPAAEPAEPTDPGRVGSARREPAEPTLGGSVPAEPTLATSSKLLAARTDTVQLRAGDAFRTGLHPRGFTPTYDLVLPDGALGVLPIYGTGKVPSYTALGNQVIRENPADARPGHP